ncbi:acyltransferase family protein [Blastococcus capsensis]|uniref:acyltransferase family protein n=1 Tax=Blastococcus capsensis TaxID=1564163 RepID=UPI00253FB26D|nr:acyltransferase [Blastococcus capsensis]MDK3257082.1 acyltransferase [Blastococcus capsensis]
MTATGTRDRYIDALRAAALVRVVTFHAVGWTWLPLLFPSMGIMFALGGAMVAGSLDRATSIAAFYRARLRRLLPPLWVFGAVLVPVMIALGWQVSPDDGSSPLTWDTLWFWVFPLSDPPASSQGYLWVVPLWYIRTYLWFLLLSPGLLWLFRRWPLRLTAVPVVTMLLLAAGLLMMEGRSYEVVLQLCVYACCWLLGFAHHDGMLRRLPLGPTLAGGVALMAAGAWYASSYQQEYGATSIDNIPLANMLYATGAVVVLLRLYPRWDRVRPIPVLDRMLTLVNSRAMTIYLWGNVAIALAPLVLDHTGLAQGDAGDTVGVWLRYGTAWALIFVAVLLVGWVEDVAARRRPRVLPWGSCDGLPPGSAGAGRTVPMAGDVVAGDAVSANLFPGGASPAVPAPRSTRVTVFAGNVVQTVGPVSQPPAEPEPAVHGPAGDHGRER